MPSMTISMAVPSLIARRGGGKVALLAKREAERPVQILTRGDMEEVGEVR